MGRLGLLVRPERCRRRRIHHAVLRKRRSSVHHLSRRLGRHAALCRHLVGRPDRRTMGIYPFPHPDLHRFGAFRTAEHHVRHGRYLRRQEPGDEYPRFPVEDLDTDGAEYGRMGIEREISARLGRTGNFHQPLVSEDEIQPDAVCLQHRPRSGRRHADDTRHVP